MEANTRRASAELVRLAREPTGTADVSPELVAFFANAVALQRPSEFPMAGAMSASTVGALAAAGAEAVLVPDSPSVATARLQVEVEVAYAAEKKRVEKEAEQVAERADAVESAALAARVAGDDSAGESAALVSLYKHIFTLVAVRGGMEDALSDPTVEAETVAALDSVFPQHGVRSFTGLSTQEKMLQLKELTSIVVGIRLFNKALGKGGAKLEEPGLPALQGARTLQSKLTAALAATSDTIKTFITVIDKKAVVLRPQEPALLRLRDELTFHTQFAVLLETLLDDVQKGATAVEGLLDQYDEEMEGLKQLVGSHASVPKDKVYPRLDALGQLHAMLADEKKMVDTRMKLGEMLLGYNAPFASKLTLTDLHEAQALGAGVALTDDRGPPPAADPAAAAASVGAEREEGGLQGLEYAGFCPVTVVKRNGLLLPASEAAGCVRYNNKVFGFATDAYAAAFAAAPDAYVKEVLAVARDNPALVKLLTLGEAFPGLDVRSTASMLAGPLTCDFGTQTPTHFQERHIDYSYEWNEWALRRRALQLANLRQKRTKSQQSTLSHFRRENETQVWLPKQATTQTRAQKGTTMAQKKRYIGGLRGSPHVKLNVVSVELDIGQPYEH